MRGTLKELQEMGGNVQVFFNVILWINPLFLCNSLTLHKWLWKQGVKFSFAYKMGAKVNKALLITICPILLSEHKRLYSWSCKTDTVASCWLSHITKYSQINIWLTLLRKSMIWIQSILKNKLIYYHEIWYIDYVKCIFFLKYFKLFLWQEVYFLIQRILNW